MVRRCATSAGPARPAAPKIPWELGLLGHSDADVVVHAIMDALLGAAALRDIGRHFPDTDPQYKGISSILLLQKVGALLKEKGYQIVNIDATIIAQKPKMASFIPDMVQTIAEALSLSENQVNIKATTEFLHFLAKRHIRFGRQVPHSD